MRRACRRRLHERRRDGVASPDGGGGGSWCARPERDELRELQLHSSNERPHRGSTPTLTSTPAAPSPHSKDGAGPAA
eukprot:5566396-Prymnesium_polylepis.1